MKVLSSISYKLNRLNQPNAMLFILVKALSRVQYGKITRGRGREANIARGEVL